MMVFLKKYKLIIVSVIILLVLIFLSLKTPFPKRLLDYLNKDLIEESNALKKQQKDLLDQMKQDQENFKIKLDQQILKINEFKLKYQNSLQKIKKYEEALNNYNIGDFNSNFREFTRNVNSADTLSINRFNISN